MTISVTNASGDKTEFYNVPLKVGNAVITLLYECENDDSDIVSEESEDKE